MVRVQVLLYVHYFVIWIQLNACSVLGTLFINVQIENPHHHVDIIIWDIKIQIERNNDERDEMANVERQTRTKLTTTVLLSLHKV